MYFTYDKIINNGLKLSFIDSSYVIIYIFLLIVVIVYYFLDMFSSSLIQISQKE